MKKIAVIGFGNHVKKNILPSIDRLNGLNVESIYVREPARYVADGLEYGIKVKHVDDKIDTQVDWVYISTPISSHYDLTRKYLQQGLNVICEKPLTNNSEKTIELLDLSREKNLYLHEVCMYKYHKQFQHLRNYVAENSQTLKSISTKFTIPHLSKEDIRYKKELGGGALLDVGYYPLSLLMALFGKPQNIKFTKLSENGYDVDLSGIAIFEYKRFYCSAEWGIGLPYSNEVTVTTEKQVIKYDRIFSKPETHCAKALVKEGFDCYEVDIGKDNHFVNMFRSIVLEDSKINLNDANLVIGLSAVLDEINLSEIN